MKKSDSRIDIKLSSTPLLKPGTLNNKSFDLLLYFTDIRSEALRAYYVDDLTKSQAYKSMGLINQPLAEGPAL